MNNLLAILGQNPKRSLSIFLSGLGLFSIGLVFIAIGYFYHHIWQMIGIFILAIACALAIWGYLGLFANRWFHILNRNNPNNEK
jgi:hypothetical protein